jgi:prepilin-type N-terminal cleavage/methylation domain-containing protein
MIFFGLCPLLKNMKMIVMKTDKMVAARESHSCHASRVTRHTRAFTLVEMLTVISIIAVLAALLMPALAAAKRQAKITQAKLEISQMVTAIQNYDSAYSRFPASSAEQTAAGANDFTFGGTFETPGVPISIGTSVNGSISNNCDVIAILMDITNTTVTSVNMNHQKNPQQTLFLNAKMSGWDPLMGGSPRPGVDKNLVYRDPWGNPYVISMDLNYDEQCQDAFYSKTIVSQQNGNAGYFGLVDPDGSADNFLYHGKVMVWSAGPDGKIDPNSPASGANAGVNRDNILSWQ